MRTLPIRGDKLFVSQRTKGLATTEGFGLTKAQQAAADAAAVNAAFTLATQGFGPQSAPSLFAAAGAAAGVPILGTVLGGIIKLFGSKQKDRRVFRTSDIYEAMIQMHRGEAFRIYADDAYLTEQSAFMLRAGDVGPIIGWRPEGSAQPGGSTFCFGCEGFKQQLVSKLGEVSDKMAMSTTYRSLDCMPRLNLFARPTGEQTIQFLRCLGSKPDTTRGVWNSSLRSSLISLCTTAVKEAANATLVEAKYYEFYAKAWNELNASSQPFKKAMESAQFRPTLQKMIDIEIARRTIRVNAYNKLMEFAQAGNVAGILDWQPPEMTPALMTIDELKAGVADTTNTLAINAAAKEAYEKASLEAAQDKASTAIKASALLADALTKSTTAVEDLQSRLSAIEGRSPAATPGDGKPASTGGSALLLLIASLAIIAMTDPSVSAVLFGRKKP